MAMYSETICHCVRNRPKFNSCGPFLLYLCCFFVIWSSSPDPYSQSLYEKTSLLYSLLICVTQKKENYTIIHWKKYINKIVMMIVKCDQKLILCITWLHGTVSTLTLNNLMCQITHDKLLHTMLGETHPFIT